MKWKQQGNKVILEYSGKEVYWIMPEGYSLENTSDALLSLTEYLLFSPFMEIEQRGTRKKGNNVGVSFSSGVDSTAVSMMFPDAILSFMERDFKSKMVHDNAINMIAKMDRDVVVVKSNHELIRKDYGKMPGFSTDLACACHLVLLADHLDIGAIAVGTVLESAYLYSGHTFRVFLNHAYYKKWTAIFKKAGIDILFPTVGLSEVITSKIVTRSKYGNLSYSCLRKKGGCNNCYKCYRKGLLTGKRVSLDRETQAMLEKRPLKMGTALIYGLQKNKLSLPEVKEFINTDLSFLERYYGEALKCLPVKYRSVVKSFVESEGIEPMTDEDVKKMEALDFK